MSQFALQLLSSSSSLSAPGQFLSHADGNVRLQTGIQGAGEAFEFTVTPIADVPGVLLVCTLGCLGGETGQYLSHENGVICLLRGPVSAAQRWIYHGAPDGTAMFAFLDGFTIKYLSTLNGQVVPSTTPTSWAVRPSATLYGGGPFYQPDTLAAIRDSDFTTVMCWGVHAWANGDLYYNDTQLCSGGKYVARADWPAQLLATKHGGTVSSIRFSLLTSVIEQAAMLGTGRDSPIYKNFAALRQAIPAIDGIDLDYEPAGTFDQQTLVAVCQMLDTLGFNRITFCPYTDMSAWAACLTAVRNYKPGLVTGYFLQCYSGGSLNLTTVPEWIASIAPILGSKILAAEFIDPGLWCRHGDKCADGMHPAHIQSHFQTWAKLGVTGGFIWLYDDILKCPNSGTARAYADAIVNGIL